MHGQQNVKICAWIWLKLYKNKGTIQLDPRVLMTNPVAKVIMVTCYKGYQCYQCLHSSHVYLGCIVLMVTLEVWLPLLPGLQVCMCLSLHTYFIDCYVYAEMLEMFWSVDISYLAALRNTCQTHLILLHLITPITFRKNYIYWSWLGM